MNPSHKPVLLEETIKSLNIRENKIYLDLTLGLGGHSNEILKHLNNTDGFMHLIKIKMLLI